MDTLALKANPARRPWVSALRPGAVALLAGGMFFVLMGASEMAPDVWVWAAAIGLLISSFLVMMTSEGLAPVTGAEAEHWRALFYLIVVLFMIASGVLLSVVQARVPVAPAQLQRQSACVKQQLQADMPGQLITRGALDDAQQYCAPAQVRARERAATARAAQRRLIQQQSAAVRETP